MRLSMKHLVLTAAALAAMACGGYGSPDSGVAEPPGAHQVNAVGETSWSPATITIPVGEAVTFRNASGITHDLQFDNVAGRPANVGQFTSGLREVTFGTAGTFQYHCNIHPVMRGQVVVQS